MAAARERLRQRDARQKPQQQQQQQQQQQPPRQRQQAQSATAPLPPQPQQPGVAAQPQPLYGPQPPREPQPGDDPLLSMRPDLARQLEGRNIQFVDMSKLPAKYRQQYGGLSDTLKRRQEAAATRKQQPGAVQQPQQQAGEDAGGAAGAEVAGGGVAPGAAAAGGRRAAPAVGVGGTNAPPPGEGGGSMQEVGLGAGWGSVMPSQEQWDALAEEAGARDAAEGPVLASSIIMTKASLVELLEESREAGLDGQLMLAEALALGVQVGRGGSKGVLSGGEACRREEVRAGSCWKAL